MTREEKVQEAPVAIAKKYEEQSAEKLRSLPREAKTERKALSIAKNEAGICAAFAGMHCSPNGAITSERYYTIRENRVFGNPEFSGYRDWYDGADEEDRHVFLIYAHAIGMVKSNIYRENELRRAREAGDVASEFENGIIVNVLDAIMNEWRAWWKENGCVPCGV